MPGIQGQRLRGADKGNDKDNDNEKLSDDRAHSVRQYIIDHGIAPDRLTAKGFGDTRPIASNDTKEGRAKNRRVELHITSQPAAVP